MYELRTTNDNVSSNGKEKMNRMKNFTIVTPVLEYGSSLLLNIFTQLGIEKNEKIVACGCHGNRGKFNWIWILRRKICRLEQVIETLIS